MVFQTVLCAEKVFGPNTVLQYLKHRPDVTAETLRRAGKGCCAEHSHRTVRDGAETWPWRLHKHKQITNKYRPKGETHEREQVPNICQNAWEMSLLWNRWSLLFFTILERQKFSIGFAPSLRWERSLPTPTLQRTPVVPVGTLVFSLRLSGTHIKNCSGLSPVGHSLRFN